MAPDTSPGPASPFTRIDHAGITVRDLDRSIAFYTDLLGLEVVSRFSNEDTLRGQLMGLPGVVRLDIAFLAPPGAPQGSARLELLQVTPAPPPIADPANTQAGGVHVCLETEDMLSTVDRLRAEGVPFIGDPIRLSDGDKPGYLVYLVDPDGVRIELIEWPVPRVRPV